jgi:hypothetical protein
VGWGRIASAALAAAFALPASAVADDARTETAIASKAADAQLVRESYVSLAAPLPESAGAHPAACDRIGYLRFRNPGGPSDPSRADAVITLIPGILASAGSLDPVARNVVRLAAERGRNFEVWAIDRRSACLEDHFGTQAAERASDVRAAFDYYYGGKEVEGRRFGGFVPPSEAQFMREFGLGLTVRDWHEVITRELPDRAVRERKLICGGHSLGGPLTAALASWDYDGDPETKDDAGYLDCAGLAGLDTTVALDGESGGPAGAGMASQVAAQSGGSPYVNAPPFTPPVMQLTSIAAVGAFQRPAEESVFNQLIPHDPDFELTLRLLYSKDAAQFASGQPSIRDVRLTGATVFGGIFDDNSAGISILRASLGSAVGGEFADKNFPAPDPTLALPEQPKGPLYRWVDYDKAGTPGHDIPLNDEGKPYSTRESEVTDLHEFARVFFDAPADFVEQYFPTRLATDVVAAEGGDRSGDLQNLRYDGPSQRPILLVTAGDSDSNDPSDDDGPEKEGDKPNDKPLSRDVVLPGYNHLDVAAAAWKQNDGRLEPSSTALVDFAMAVTGAAAAAGGPGVPGVAPGTGPSGCLPERARFTRRALGRLRLGATRAAAVRALGRPARARGRTATWCVSGTRRGWVTAVFARGRVVAVASTAPGHRWRGLGPGSPARRVHGRRVARRTFARRASRTTAVVFRTSRRRVRLVALTRRSVIRRRGTLRRYLRAAAAR